MVNDDDRLGEVARETRSLFELPPRRLQLEVQTERRKARVARAPFRVVHHSRLGLVPHGAHEIVVRVRFENTRAVVMMQPRLADRHGRQARFSNAGDECHLATRISRIPFGLDIDAANYVPLRAIASVVLDEVRAAKRAVVAVAKGDGLRIAQPRVIVSLRIPDVKVRVCDRNQRAVSDCGSKKCRRAGSSAKRTGSCALTRVPGSTRATMGTPPARKLSRISLPSGSTTSTSVAKL